MAAFLDSNSSDEEDFEGFVVSPEEKASYKVWTKKRSASEAFDDGNDSEDNVSDDEDDDEEEDDDDDEDDDYQSAEEEDEGNEENDEVDDVLGDISLQDSGDEKLSSHTDQCPVCLMSLKEQLLGTPNNCPHVFCFECIQEWAKNATTCPVGRKPFTEILVHAARKGPILQRIPVEERKADDDEVEEDPTYCEVCGGYDREDRMLLCDGCDQGYHMDCLTPPVEYVPIDEWYCPACSSQLESHEDPEELPEEEHVEEGLRDVPCVRATRGRPRGSTARRVSDLGRTGTTRRARTVASTRGRGRTQRGRGRGRGRGKSSSRGRGRGGGRPSTRGRSSSTTTGRKKRRRKKTSRGKKTTGTSRTKRGRKSCKTKTLRPIKRRRIAEEDEVSPFIYEPVRRGRTVHARLLESLNSPGPTAEPGRSTSLGRVPFPSRVEASSSFSLFGNAYALHDFADEEEDPGETAKVEHQTSAWSSESANPDVLGSIFQGLDSLLSSSAKVARDGKILKSANQSVFKGSSSSNAKASLASSEGEMKLSSDVEITERTAEEGKRCLKETDKSSKEPDATMHSSKIERHSENTCFRENIFEKVSLIRTADTFAGSCSMLSGTSLSHKTFSPSPLIERRASSPSTPVSSKSVLSSFRIPKRSSKSQDEPSPVSPNSDPNPNSFISNFKIPKRTKSMFCDYSTKKECSNTGIRKSVEQTFPAPPTCRTDQKVSSSHFTSSSRGVANSSCVTESKSAASSLKFTNSVRPMMQKNVQRKTGTEPSVTNSSSVMRSHATTIRTINSNTALSGAAISTGLPSAAAAAIVIDGGSGAGPSVTSLNSVTRCQAKNVTSVTHSHTSTASTTSHRVLTNSSTACHLAKASDILPTHSTTSSSLTKVTPLIDHLKPVEGKEQRRSNMEIIKMLQEKQKNMRQQLSCDSKSSTSSRPVHSGKVVDTNALSRKEIHAPDKSSACSRGVTLPVAIVKPSPQVPSLAVNASSVIPGSSMQNSPVKSIASGIIDAHSSNTWEFKRVRSASSSYSGHEATTRKQDGTATGTNGDREQQRKLGIARLQRHEQIVDEVKLALKPFFKHGEINKDDYKLIMRKSVEKIKESSSSVDRDRVIRLVKKYIKKIKGVNFPSSP